MLDESAYGANGAEIGNINVAADLLREMLLERRLERNATRVALSGFRTDSPTRGDDRSPASCITPAS
jgi:hypothetical protein